MENVKNMETDQSFDQSSNSQELSPKEVAHVMNSAEKLVDEILDEYYSIQNEDNKKMRNLKTALLSSAGAAFMVLIGTGDINTASYASALTMPAVYILSGVSTEIQHNAMFYRDFFSRFNFFQDKEILKSFMSVWMSALQTFSSSTLEENRAFAETSAKKMTTIEEEILKSLPSFLTKPTKKRIKI